MRRRARADNLIISHRKKTNWHQFLMGLSCYWQWISSKRYQSGLRIHPAIVPWIHSYFDNAMKVTSKCFSRDRSGVQSAVVLLPLLGITWLFGVLTFNSDTLAFQYLFAIFNSLQVCRYVNIVGLATFELLC